MKGMIFALALACGSLACLAQEASPTPAPSPAAEDASKAPRMNEAVDLSETPPAENMEIPPPADEPAPDKAEEIKEPLADEDQSAPAPPVSGKVELTAADAGKTVRAEVGNLVVITLQSNPSTGYNWELRNFDYGVADFYNSETVAADSGNVLFGAPTKTIVRLQAVKPGAQEIKLVYRRQWEQPDQVAETFQFRLEVDGPQTPPSPESPAPVPSPAP